MNISVDTRDRLSRLAAPAETLEDVVVAAVDVKERSDQFERGGVGGPHLVDEALIGECP
jgi:hypothetical protein